MKFCLRICLFFFLNSHFLIADISKIISQHVDTVKKTLSVGEPRKSEITKLFFHHGTLADRLICYFDNEPICTYHPHKKNDNANHTIELFLPMSVVKNSEIKQLIKKVNAYKNDHYSINVKEVTTPLSGMKIVVAYDPKQIVCEYAHCFSISAQNGLIVSLHHKSILETLAIKSDKLLHTVSAKSNEKPKIMLDFGHGGSDDGKIGFGQIKEKDINLQVGKKVASLLRSRGYDVELTRTQDTFVPLDERTRAANKKMANLFISIHSNSSRSADITGIETYWSSRCFSNGSLQAPHNIKEIIKRVMNKLDDASKLLANTIHSNIVTTVQKVYPIKDRSIKQSLAQVLVGTDMPSALIEIGFLSNPTETKRLQDPQYQSLVAQGICKGIDQYCATIFV